jgi:pyruvate/2-oxoglutarate dehydrogenase complex dihydrolipoamide dehydrogenase (E3) component
MRLWRRHETGVPRPSKTPQNITLYRGHARFASPHAVEVAPYHHNTGRLRAGRIFINVGGRAVPPMPGINEVAYLTNSSMMDVDFLPHHLVIVGGRHIGLDGCRRVQAATSAAIFI